MAELKVVIGELKTGKSHAFTKENAVFMGKKIGDVLSGDLIDFPGYEFQITGGSDISGFPMRKDITSARKKILTKKSIGAKKLKKGQRMRLTMAGNYVHENITCVNLKISKAGKSPLIKVEEKVEEAKAE